MILDFCGGSIDRSEKWWYKEKLVGWLYICFLSKDFFIEKGSIINKYVNIIGKNYIVLGKLVCMFILKMRFFFLGC